MERTKNEEFDLSKTSFPTLRGGDSKFSKLIMHYGVIIVITLL